MSHRNCLRAIAGAFAGLALGCFAGFTQEPKQYSDQDYASAEKFMAYNVNPLAYKGQVNAQWLDDDRFWYREVDDSGISYVVVDPAKSTRGQLIDQDKLVPADLDARMDARNQVALDDEVVVLSAPDSDVRTGLV